MKINIDNYMCFTQNRYDIYPLRPEFVAANVRN
jgi:hypothetical protein